jgi:hypothetical protein
MKWVRRHATATAIIAAIFLLVILLLGSSLWFAVQQARRRDGVDADPKAQSSSTSITGPVCGACSLIPGAADERQKTAAIADRAVAARARVGKMLARWQSDPDLEGLRDASALDKLSPEECQECHALWEAVGSLLRQARESNPR